MERASKEIRYQTNGEQSETVIARRAWPFHDRLPRS